MVRLLLARGVVPKQKVCICGGETTWDLFLLHFYTRNGDIYQAAKLLILHSAEPYARVSDLLFKLLTPEEYGKLCALLAERRSYGM